MGYKNVCINCKRVENLGTDYSKFKTGKCPECQNLMFFVNHRFKPPKKSDLRSWEVVRYLIENGYDFKNMISKNGLILDYPNNIKEAKSFIDSYKS